MKIVPDEELVQEALQAIFVYIYQKRASITTPQAPLAYLCVSLKRAILRLKKIQENKHEIPLDTNYDFSLTIDAEAAIISTELSQEKIQALQQSIDMLSPRQREVIYLKYYNNLSGEEIAESMGITHQSARNLLGEALKALRNNALLDPQKLFILLFSISLWN